MSGKGPSRRDMLKGAGLAAVPLAAPAMAAPVPPQRETLESLTASEAAILTAVTGRLIPSDASGPGAIEARASRYIDRALAGSLAASRDAYRVGLSALDAHARESRGGGFAGLPPEAQDKVLTDFQTGKVPSFPGAAGFFALLRAHTLQGTFGDPYYGGNEGFVGWDMLGYPGVRVVVPPTLQRMGQRPPGNHMSAYDTAMFHKADADDGGMGGHGH
jgi:gluconate 2-dehydrogenase gamma chain